MPGPAVAAIGAVASIGSGLIGANAAKKAGKAQAAAADAAAAEQRAAREEMRTLLQPYVDAGTPALQQMMALSGLAPTTTDWAGYATANPELMSAYQAQTQAPAPAMPGQGGFASLMFQRVRGQEQAPPSTPQTLEQFAQQWHQQRGGDLSRFQTTGEQAQQQAIARIESDPIFQSLLRQGEEGILQNASATGGLRGGNVQGALAQFRPAMLNQQINEQYARLAGLTQLGQNSAAGVGNAGITTATNIGQALESAGAARAGAALGQGKAWGGALNNLGTIAGMAVAGPTAMRKWGF